MIDYIYFGFYKIFAFLLGLFPNFMIVAMMKFLGQIAYTFSFKHQKIIAHNLDLAYKKRLTKKQKKAIGVSAFVNLIDTVFGIIRRDKMQKGEVIQNVIFKNEEIIKKYQEEGKNFILITGHYGNWELLSQSIAIKFNLTLVGVGRKIDSAKMDEVLRKNRERFNVEMVYKKGAMKGCIKVINQKKVVGILTDQAIRKKQSIEVDFFGEKATHTPLASILSRKFGLDLIPAYIETNDYKEYIVTIYDPIKTLKTDNQEEDLVILTQKQSDMMQKVIEQNPKQWFWMHRRWK